MISIFYKPAFLNVNSGQPFKHTGDKPKRGHLMRVSSMIRGDQIAEHIGAKYNPEDGYENDVCIYVKPHIKKDSMDFKFEGRKSYLDIIDGHNLGQLMNKYPKIGLIVCSQADMETMSGVVKNNIIFIPQHHCNFERKHRTRREITKIGMIGTKDAYGHLPEGIENELAKMNMEFVFFSQFFKREDVIDFYMNIDVQLIWRPYKKLLSNPLKMVNASSFGIPSIALDEPAFKELDGRYLPINNQKELLEQLHKLKNDISLYDDYASRCIDVSERYHIDKVAKLYKQLDN